jgi:hypothetical protein
VIKPRLRLLDTEALALHYGVAVGTIRRWASEDGWHGYGTRRHRQWDMAEARRSWEKRHADGS